MFGHRAFKEVIQVKGSHLTGVLTRGSVDTRGDRENSHALGPPYEEAGGL